MRHVIAFILFLTAAVSTAHAQGIAYPIIPSSGGGVSGTITNGTATDIVCYSATNEVAPCATAAFTWNAGLLQIGSAGSATPIIFEGATVDAFEGTVTVADFTADRTIRIPDADSVTVQGGACDAGDFISAIDATTGARTCGTPAGGSGAVTVIASEMLNYSDAGAGGTSTIKTVTIPGGTFQRGDTVDITAYFYFVGSTGTRRAEIYFGNASSVVTSTLAMTSGISQWRQETKGWIEDNSFTVTDCTNASPIVVTTAAAHSLQDEHKVTITGVLGNTNCNVTNTAITVLSPTTFSLTATTGSGAYTSGGSGNAFLQKWHGQGRHSATTINHYNGSLNFDLSVNQDFLFRCVGMTAGDTCVLDHYEITRTRP